MKTLQTIGGIAALGHTAALMVGMVLSFTVMLPLLEATPDQALTFLAGHPILVNVWTVIVDWGSASTLVILVLALHQRLSAGAPALSWAATAFGLLWAGLIISYSGLMLHHFGVVPGLSGSSPAQAAAWTALARSAWVLLTGLSAWRSGRLTRPSSYLGVLLGILGILTTIPAITEIMFMIFGPGMIVWSAWVGTVMLRRGATIAPQPETFSEPRTA